MSAAPANHNQPLITLWVVQMIGTLVIAGAAMVFFRTAGTMLKGVDPSWAGYALYAMFGSILLPLLYMRNFREVYDADLRAQKASGGTPDPAIRPVLVRALRIGGALSELPQAFGVLHVLLGGEVRWFLGATLITIALRLSYRPFEKFR